MNIKPKIVYDRGDIKWFLIQNKLLEKIDIENYEKFVSYNTDYSNGTVYYFSFPEDIDDERYEEYDIPLDCAKRLQEIFSLLQEEEFGNASSIYLYVWW